MEPYIYDVETYKTFFCCTLLSLKTNKSKIYVIDDSQSDATSLIRDVKGLYLIGYNNKTFDNIVLNYIFRHPTCTSEDLYEVAGAIIKSTTTGFYEQFRRYINNDAYKSIDLMRLLFSKKLRVSLKELECSMNFNNVAELPYPPDTEWLSKEQKQEIVDYNMNDCLATKQVALLCKEEIKLRSWTNKEFGVDVYSLDGVNLGVKILEQKLADKIGNKSFVSKRTAREKVIVKDVIYPFIKFETKEFNEVLDRYRELTLTRYYDRKAMKMKWTKYKYEPLINGYVFKYGLGGLHFETRTKAWASTESVDILSIDAESYYPSQVEQYPKYCKPKHLPDEFIDVYVGVKKERLEAKKSGDKIKNATFKLSINGAFGNMSNEYSWLYDVYALLAITINGQLMLSMLCEQLMLADITLIDVNTDGVYISLRKDQREKFDEICSWFSIITKMTLEETKFESIYFVNTGDYFGASLNKGKLEIKEKGCFITVPRLGKGMEFPIIYESIKKHYLEGKDFVKTIKEEKDILKFCSFKKLSKDFTCRWKGQKQQRVNRFYASREGAHLFKSKWNEKKKRYTDEHVLKDSPVELLNKLDDRGISTRSVNYAFYTSKARDIIYSLDSKQGQMSLF